MVVSSPDHGRGELGDVQIDTTQNQQKGITYQPLPHLAASANRTVVI
jgi:hypothetical protein